ncbi:hypothetical protein [Streptomyces sp. NBC_01439]|uniref:hypothetical protein n=1 Tax=Streptomyces sp. NBC_01439 TaxID=2903867 RepID=UPI002E2C424D|nr:hypothetical protein [Streptomyces sp. NBC_01439]
MPPSARRRRSAGLVIVVPFDDPLAGAVAAFAELIGARAAAPEPGPCGPPH